MPGQLDFSLSSPLAAALLIGGSMPIVLYAFGHAPGMAARYALRFTLTIVLSLAIWLLVIILMPDARPAGIAEALVALMAIGGFGLLYLEAWALLSRGYTLGLLLTLLKADRPLTPDELAQRYRGGQSLSWIMQHRLEGLVRAGLVRRTGAMLVLTTPRGRVVAWLYKATIVVLGLGRTG
jgi:hypothetical protein